MTTKTNFVPSLQTIEKGIVTFGRWRARVETVFAFIFGLLSIVYGINALVTYYRYRNYVYVPDKMLDYYWNKAWISIFVGLFIVLIGYYSLRLSEKSDIFATLRAF